jgi:hypothetical protein
MVSNEERRKTIAAARSIVRRLEYRAELNAWLERTNKQPRILYRTKHDALVGRPQHRDVIVRR